MEELEVTTHWIYILTPGALFAEHVTSIPKFPFDTLFLLLAHTYVSQAVSVIFPAKAKTYNHWREGISDIKVAELERNAAE